MWKRSGWVLVAVSLLVAGCGFQLRGKVDLPDSLTEPYVRGDDAQLVSTLNQALRFSGAAPTSSASAATATIEFVQSVYSRNVRTVDSRGLATGYELSYVVVYRVLDQSGEVALPNARIEQKRNFNWDETQVLQKEQEERELKEQMQTDIVQQMLRRLATLG